MLIRFSYANICATSDTQYGAAASTSATTSCSHTEDGGTETAIFYLDPQNNEILPTWINPDGSECDFRLAHHD
jgi:hypothetical protein